VLALVPLALGTFSGCSDEDLTEQTSQKVKRLSDLDDDGLYISDDCMRADGSDGCVIMPGPTECTYLQVTTTTTVIVDSAGNIVREETSECVTCLGPDFTEISETCTGSGTVTPVVCEPAPSGSGTTMDCWICTYPDGTTSYECIPPTTYCTTDADCPTGEHCEYYPPPPTCGDPATGVPCAEPGAPTDANFVAPGGQCVPDAPTYCATDADCPMGYYCDYYAYPTDPGTGSGGSSGGSGGAPAADIWAGGQCLPIITPPPPPECTSDADCGPYGTCVFTCEVAPTDPPSMCKGYCEYETPPPSDCWVYADATTCEADPRCDWLAEGGFVPCDPSGTCGYGYCGPAASSP